MRSVQFFPSIDRGALADLLNSMGVRREDEWSGIEAGTVWVSLYDFGSFEALVRNLIEEGATSETQIAALWSIRDEIAGYQVEVQVSGRVHGRDQMLSVVRRLLAEGGYGMDDHSEGLWSLSDIEQGRPSGEMFRL